MKKAFLFSDLHCSNKQLLNLYDFVIQNDQIKAIISAGDIVNMGEPVWFMEKFIKSIGKLKRPFLWVPGNNDFGRAYYKLNAKYKSVEGRVQKLAVSNNTNVIPAKAGIQNWIPDQARDDNLNKSDDGKLLVRRFTGVGGIPVSWAGQYSGESMIDQKDIAGSIFVSHFPPPGRYFLQKNDQQFNHSTIQQFNHAPLVHICGHLHYRWGTAYLGQTKIIQLASLETGHYAIMDLDTLAVEFERF